MNYTLSRLPYFVLASASNLFLENLVATYDGTGVLIACLLLPLYALFLTVPRARDCGWPPWIGWLSMLPLIGIITSVALVFGPTRMGVFEKEDEEGEA